MNYDINIRVAHRNLSYYNLTINTRDHILSEEMAQISKKKFKKNLKVQK